MCACAYSCAHASACVNKGMAKGLTLPYDNNLGQLLGTGAVMRFQGWRCAHWNEAVG